ncbi:hypothetical protein CB1_000061027 [Camelus ferus]|nr:hypothetical protein CB1_000061027 [Camelus ferus]
MFTRCFRATRLRVFTSGVHAFEFSAVFSLLLTGTPIQNSLQELYSLLGFAEPELFPREQVEDFVQRYQDIEKESESGKFPSRKPRPRGLGPEDAFENETAKKVKLQNVLSQLRKCVGHPYLFDGVEPEPFEIGDHLIEASGKLHLLDKLLAFLYSKGFLMCYVGYEMPPAPCFSEVTLLEFSANPAVDERDFTASQMCVLWGHRVLLFSQMTQMLDILQDYMDYRGGVGMNLTAADTVIFVDSDFNPQNDLQAAARAHRIGQNKSVKVIRLVGRDTVEEIVCRKAASKLQLTSTVMEGGRFTLGAPRPSADADLRLSEILKFGLDKLLSSEGSTMDEIDLEPILGETKDGQWLSDALPTEEEGSRDQEEEMALVEPALLSRSHSSQVWSHKGSDSIRMAWWQSNNYQSFCLPPGDSEPEDLEEEEDENSARLDYEDPDSTSIKYVSGDVTHPQAGAEDAVIVHCLALIVAQHRDRANVLSGIKMAALEEGLKKIFFAAKKKKACQSETPPYRSLWVPEGQRAALHGEKRGNFTVVTFMHIYCRPQVTLWEAVYFGIRINFGP